MTRTVTSGKVRADQRGAPSGTVGAGRLVVPPEMTGAARCVGYAEDVVSGAIPMGRRVTQACERFLRELRESRSAGFRWEWRPELAERPIAFIEQFLRPTKGDYDRMALLGWQCFVEGNLYGWVDKKTGLRRFREALIIVGSGNGKSTMVGGNAIYAASKDGERGAEVYLLANSKEQAGVIFEECSAEIRNSPALARHFRVLRDRICFDATASKIQPLATDSRKQQGRNVHMAVFDELQDYRNYKLINVIKAKTKKRSQPLTLYITTLGSVLDGPLMDLYVVAGNVLDGTVTGETADRFFAFVAEIDREDDPADQTKWIKANPSVGVTLRMEDLIAEWERCKLVPAERANFINQQLNVFTSLDELSMLEPEVILKNDRTVDPEQLRGRRCYGGFDLSETEDFTSACLEFPMDDIEPGLVFILSHSWVPRKKVEVDREKLDWASLEADGLLTVCEGEYIDWVQVLDWFRQMRELYAIECIGYDPAKATLLVRALSQEFAVEVVRQGELTLTAPLDDLRERFLDGHVAHNRNRLFNWYLGNVKLSRRSAGATYLPTKQNKYRKIDGFAAALDAHTVYMRRMAVEIPPDRQISTIIKL